ERPGAGCRRSGTRARLPRVGSSARGRRPSTRAVAPGRAGGHRPRPRREGIRTRRGHGSTWGRADTRRAARRRLRRALHARLPRAAGGAGDRVDLAPAGGPDHRGPRRRRRVGRRREGDLGHPEASRHLRLGRVARPRRDRGLRRGRPGGHDLRGTPAAGASHTRPRSLHRRRRAAGVGAGPAARSAGAGQRHRGSGRPAGRARARVEPDRVCGGGRPTRRRAAPRTPV
ncbi:MAG: hypothetical protein AVDCRST_MAG69-2299, partial [uncultured Solirubrobacteraceae bacterium]